MPTTEKHKPSIIAMCGKGGVGKTSLSAMIVKILLKNPTNKVLAIDADPAIGLASALGIEVTKTVDDIRNDLIRQLSEGDSVNRRDLLSWIDYEMLTAIEDHQNLAFLAIGRPEREGCYCRVNHILKDIIASITTQFDYVVIDGEAGVEQVNRRVMEKVTHLVLVSDASARGLKVAATIKEVAETAIEYDRLGLILNRLRDEEERHRVATNQDLNCLGWVPEDDTIRMIDIEGRSILDVPDGPAAFAAKDCITALGVPGVEVST